MSTALPPPGPCRADAEDAGVATAFCDLPAGRPVHFEWSLRLSTAGGVALRDTVTYWVPRGSQPFTPAELASLAAPLRGHRFPAALAATLLADGPRALNVGFSFSGGVLDRLYLHHRPPSAVRDIYRGFRWTHSVLQQVDYDFHLLPVPCSDPFADVTHPALRPLLRALLDAPMLWSMSGVWTRQVPAGTDQVCLTYPWLPRLRSVAWPLASHLRGAVTGPALARWSDVPLRHIALSGRAGRNPHVTLYSSGRVPRQALSDAAAARRLAQGSAAEIAAITHRDVLRHSLLPATSRQDVTEPGRLSRFYDTADLPAWRRLLGTGLHYHFGCFPAAAAVPSSTGEAAFERAVDRLGEHIAPGASVYDLGCGWGGTMTRLARTRDCDVTGITSSRTQYDYCRGLGLAVRFGDMERTLPPGYFDTLLFVESFEHVRGKFALLRTLRRFGRSLVMKVHCQNRSLLNPVFADTMWMLHEAALRALLPSAGWTIRHWRNCRAESMPTIALWRQRLAREPPGSDEHIEVFRAFVEDIAADAETWAEANPLIELYAT